MAQRLLDADESLRLSRSWTTRAQRPGEPDDAYVFVDRPTFEQRIAEGGFLEYAEFLGNLYGTPVPEPSEVDDLLLEIEIAGARQVLEHHPDATVILLVPPSEEVQAARLRGRGDPESHVEARLAEGRRELAHGREIAHHEVVNEDLEQAAAEILGILSSLRRT
jgi:guanylate kinase